jgi:uncharacterized phage protein (TIGR01671 family)
MREIRLWDKHERCMIYADEAKKSTNLLAIGLHGLPIAVDRDSFKDDEIVGWNVDHRYIPMEQIEARDKSGKKIYEGDIVATGTGPDYARSIVRIGEGETESTEYCRSQRYYGVYLERSVGLEDLLLDGEMLVLGNIYENADLLEK